MSRLDRFRFGSFRRRKFATIVIICISVLLFSLSILIFFGVFGFRAELVSVAFTEQSENARYNGVGLNLDYIPNINLIRNPSFEKESSYYSLTVVDSSVKSVYFSPEEVLQSGIDVSRATGAPIRIVSIDASGTMQLRNEGIISGFESASLGQISGIDISGEGENYNIVKTCTFQNTVTALTDSGTVLADITSDQLSKAYDGGNVSFADICCNGSTIIAVTGDGQIFTSVDGKTFLELAGDDFSEENYSVRACGATANCITILTADKKLYIYESGEYYRVDIPSGLIPVMMSSTANDLLVICEDGTVLRSANGLVYSVVDTQDIYDERSPEQVINSAGRFFILNDDGSVTVIGDEVSFLTGTSGDKDKAVSLTVTDSGQIVASTTDKTVVLISETTDSIINISSRKMSVDKVYEGVNGKLLFASDGSVYMASVLSDFTLENTIPDDSISPGDLCMIETNNSYTSLEVDESSQWKTAPEEGVWDIYGQGTSLVLTNDCQDGSHAARLSGTTNNEHLLSQKLPGSISDNFIKDKFYKISVNLKSVKGSIVPETIKVWLDGGSTFGTEGMKCSNIKNNYTEYSTVFVVNNLMEGDGGIRLNISFDGVGTVLIDHIYVGPDSIGDSDIPESFSEAVIASSPEAIRLNNLGIGSNGFSDGVFWGVTELSSGATYIDDNGNSTQVSDVRSLEKSLRLVRDASSDPWFVFGSYMSQEQVSDILAYMCGSVSSVYGTLRITNGTALPWSRQFEKIYIEIADTDDCFTSDIQRGSYVDYVIGMITRSEYYIDVKDRIVFIDGMRYDGGTMLSSADAHSSSMNFSSYLGMENRDKSFATRLSEAYEEIRTIAPRVTSASDRGEFISSLDLSGNFSFAQYLDIVTSDSAYFVEMTMINCPISFKHSSYGDYSVFARGAEMKTALEMMGLIKDIAGSDRMYINVTDSMREGGQNAADFLDKCSAVQFDRDGDSYIVITNTSDTMQQFVMYNGAKSYLSSSVDRYSVTGTHLNTKTLTNSYRRYSLQPGESIIVTLDR